MEEEKQGENFKKREKGVKLGGDLGLLGWPVFHVRNSSVWTVAVTCHVPPRQPPFLHDSTKVLPPKVPLYPPPTLSPTSGYGWQRLGVQ